MGKSIFHKDNLLKRNERIKRKKCIYIAFAIIIAVAVFMLAVSSVH
jgi:t-SNARE complex subunit (syntaxin)